MESNRPLENFLPSPDDHLKSSVNEDFPDLIQTPQLSSSILVESNRPLKNFLPSPGNHLSRPVIPTGPRFQADVPKWEGLSLKYCVNDADSKWLGKQIEIETLI